MVRPERLASDGTGRGPEVARAAAALRAGAIIAFPTETVYALAVKADDPAAVRRLSQLKGRPEGKPFAILIADASDMPKHARVPPAATALARAFWPGPLTLVLPGHEGGRVGLRLPDHPVARAIARAVGGVVATSANRSGAPPALSADEIAAVFGESLECIIEARAPGSGRASSVVAVNDEGWQISREGDITAQQIADVIGPSSGQPAGSEAPG